MSVLIVTLVASTCLLAVFILLYVLVFWKNQSGAGRRGIDQESLLPLEEETPRVVGEPLVKTQPHGQGKGSTRHPL